MASLPANTENIPHIPYREELEKRLGLSYNLNGSFASLWAIEAILTTARKNPV